MASFSELLLSPWSALQGVLSSLKEPPVLSTFTPLLITLLVILPLLLLFVFPVESRQIATMKISVLTEELIRPESPTMRRMFELSPIDQVQPRFHGPPMVAFLPKLPEGMCNHMRLCSPFSMFLRVHE
jgi:hypothetical protein